MNEQTEKLLRELAEKLGTTAEHLWQVLIRQAAITGTLHVVVYIAWCAVIVWGLRLVRRKTTPPPKTEDRQYPQAQWDCDGEAIAWLVWSAFALSGMIVIGCTLANTVAALINPEYWALMEILTAK